MAPSTPPPPRRVVFAAFTIASTFCLVMSPRTSPMRSAFIPSQIPPRRKTLRPATHGIHILFIFQQREVIVSRDGRGLEIMSDDGYRDFIIGRNDHGP